MKRRITVARETTSTTAITSHNEHATFSNKLIKVRQNHRNLLWTLTIVLGSEGFISRVKISIYNFGFKFQWDSHSLKSSKLDLVFCPQNVVWGHYMENLTSHKFKA